MRQDSNGDFPDPTDRASLESDRNFLLRIKDRERKLITKVKEALDRIDDGTFGICESCGRPISEKETSFAISPTWIRGNSPCSMLGRRSGRRTFS
jgi:RNA polymerase-binding protein DksA